MRQTTLIKAVCATALVATIVVQIPWRASGQRRSSNTSTLHPYTKFPDPVPLRKEEAESGAKASGGIRKSDILALLTPKVERNFERSREISENHAKALLKEAGESYTSPLPETTLEDLRKAAVAAGKTSQADLRHFLVCSDTSRTNYKHAPAWFAQISAMCAIPEMTPHKLDLMWDVAQKKLGLKDSEVVHWFVTSLVAGRYFLPSGKEAVVIVNAPDDASRTIALEMKNGAYKILDTIASDPNRVKHSKWAVDIGGNQGFVSTLIAGLLPNINLVTVELSPTNAVYVIWNMILNGEEASVRADAMPLRAANGSQPSQRSLHVLNCAMSDGSTDDVELTYDPKRIHHSNLWAVYKSANASAAAAPKPPGSHAMRVPACTLPGILAERGVEKVDILKIDCEGCEYVAVPSWPAALLENTGVVLGELHGLAARVFGMEEKLGSGQGSEWRLKVDERLSGKRLPASVFREFVNDKLAAG